MIRAELATAIGWGLSSLYISSCCTPGAVLSSLGTLHWKELSFLHKQIKLMFHVKMLGVILVAMMFYP